MMTLNLLWVIWSRPGDERTYHLGSTSTAANRTCHIDLWSLWSRGLSHFLLDLWIWSGSTLPQKGRIKISWDQIMSVRVFSLGWAFANRGGSAPLLEILCESTLYCMETTYFPVLLWCPKAFDFWNQTFDSYSLQWIHSKKKTHPMNKETKSILLTSYFRSDQILITLLINLTRHTSWAWKAVF